MKRRIKRTVRREFIIIYTNSKKDMAEKSRICRDFVR